MDKTAGKGENSMALEEPLRPRSLDEELKKLDEALLGLRTDLNEATSGAPAGTQQPAMLSLSEFLDRGAAEEEGSRRERIIV